MPLRAFTSTFSFSLHVAEVTTLCDCPFDGSLFLVKDVAIFARPSSNPFWKRAFIEHSFSRLASLSTVYIATLFPLNQSDISFFMFSHLKESNYPRPLLVQGLVLQRILNKLHEVYIRNSTCFEMHNTRKKEQCHNCFYSIYIDLNVHTYKLQFVKEIIFTIDT